MTVHVLAFKLGRNPLICFTDGRNTVGTNAIHPDASWPPAQDRISLGSRFDASETENGVARLLSEPGNEAEMEADIVSS